MTTFTHTLNVFALPDDVRLLQPPRAPIDHVTADSSALTVMTDLSKVRLITVNPEDPIDVALAVMVHAKVRMLLVLAGDGAIDGLVSADDLMGEKPLRVASRERLRRDEVMVRQVMEPVNAIQPLDLASVESALVRDVVAHLKSSHRAHALVVEAGTGDDSYIARGIFSLTQIGRQLGEPLNPSASVADSFAAIERAIS